MSSWATTVDNPFDPFTMYDEWHAYDQVLGYNTASLIARIAKTSDDLSEELQSQAIDDAVDEIVRVNASGMHRRVVQKEADNNLVADLGS